MHETQRIADSYRASTVKAAWYGPSLAELLAQISPELATTPPVPDIIQFPSCFSICSFGMKGFAIPPTAIRCRVGSPKRNGPSPRFPGTNSSPAGAKVVSSSKRRFGISPSRIWGNRFWTYLSLRNYASRNRGTRDLPFRADRDGIEHAPVAILAQSILTGTKCGEWPGGVCDETFRERTQVHRKGEANGCH